jgi:hypothetical protein
MRTALLLPAVLLGLTASAAAAEAEAWQILKGQHFIVHYTADPDFAGHVLHAAEAGYERIARDLAYTRHSDFWLWSNRKRILIYPTQAAFERATGAPPWAGGKASAAEREIATFRTNPDFLNGVLVHELAHLILREIVGFAAAVPLWLDEGVAQWEEHRDSRALHARVRLWLERGQLLPLAELVAMDSRRLRGTDRALQFYAQSASLVAFLIESYGAERFARLCRGLKDGKTFDEALRFTYPAAWRTMEQLEDAWYRSLRDAGEAVRPAGGTP